MKREYKFRVWNNGKMSYTDRGDIEVYFDEDPWDSSIHGTLMQATGLKDKTGRDIYEGDIVRCHRLRFPDEHRKDIDYTKLPWPEDHWYDCIEIGEIRWSDISFCFVEDYEKLRYDDIWPLSCGTDHRYEVIGNIYENEELLK